MIGYSIEDIIRITGGTLVPADYSGECKLNELVMDSRAVKKDDIFVALTGGATDGHKYIPAAFELGAGCCLAEHIEAPQAGPVILVKDTLLAMQQIAAEFEKNPEYKAGIMENHGVVLCGDDIAEAYQRFETLELCARTILNAKTLGRPNFLSNEQLQFHESRLPNDFQHFMNVTHPSDERAIRAEICKIVRRACDQKLMSSSYGTVSVRWQGNDFLITPPGIQRWDIDEEDIVQIKDGMAEAGKTPSHSAALHYEIYRRNPKVNAIILTQCPSLMGFCTTDAKFDVRTIPESWIFLQDVPKFEFGSQYTKMNDIAETFKSRSCVMLANDSVIVASNSLINAFDRLEVAEFAAKSLILAKPLGKLHPITDAQVEDLRVAFHVGK